MLGGAAAAWPLTVRAKPAAKPVIGFLNSASNSEWAHLFRSAMKVAGWSEDDNITVDYRNGAGDRAKIDAAAIDLIASAPDLIYAIGLPAAQSVQARTRYYSYRLHPRCRSDRLRPGHES
jgi:putative ABC transport system substrate-binding protein